MLPKKVDLWDVKDICSIVLLESEANHTYKLIGREEMRETIDHEKKSPEKYSRPHRSAVAHGINRILVLDYQ